MKTSLTKALLLSSLLLITCKNAYADVIGCDGYTDNYSDLRMYSGPPRYNLPGDFLFKAQVGHETMDPFNVWTLISDSGWGGWRVHEGNEVYGSWNINNSDSHSFNVQDSGEYCTVIKYPSKGYCNNKCFNVQDAPTITATSLNGGRSISTTVTSSVDQYSKGRGSRSITFTYINLFYGTTETKKINSSNSTVSNTYNPQHSGEYTVSVKVSDGTFSDSTNLGLVLYTGGQQCSTCGNPK